VTGGVLVLDKPAGITSFDAVRAVGRILGERKCGHAGTLDPMATGVLPVCVGAATKIAGYLSGEEKEYEAAFSFGVATDTGDATGKPVETRPGASADEASVVEALSSLVGTFLQVPPAYSAVKVGGVRSYTLARKGKEVPLAPRRVTVTGSRLLSWDPGGFSAAIACSKGFYVRALSRDMGERLGLPMTLARLRRLRVGTFGIDGSVTLDALRELAAAGAARERLIPIVEALPRMPAWEVPPDAVAAVRNGRLAGAWFSGLVADERGETALIVTAQREPLAIVGRDATGLWKILRGI
jgi:tRNA pseudouridine55 synthase